MSLYLLSSFKYMTFHIFTCIIYTCHDNRRLLIEVGDRVQVWPFKYPPQEKKMATGTFTHNSWRIGANIAKIWLSLYFMGCVRIFMVFVVKCKAATFFSNRRFCYVGSTLTCHISSHPMSYTFYTQNQHKTRRRARTLETSLVWKSEIIVVLDLIHTCSPI